MKRVFKRTISLALSVIMLVFSFAGCGNKTTNKEVEQEADNGYITRGEWLEMLADTFGFDDYEQETAYYTDIDSDNELFAAVQSCRERSMLSEDTTEFKADDVATLGFVASTAVLASGVDYTRYGETDDDTNTALIKCAKETNICPDITTEDSVLRSGVEEVYASTVIEAAKGLFLAETGEEICEVDYAEDVVDCSQDSDVTVDSDGVLTADETSGLEVGSVVICQATEEYPNGHAVKVTEVSTDENGNTIYKTEEAEFEDVYENVDVSTVAEGTADNFVPAEGVTIIRSSDVEAEESRCETPMDGIEVLGTDTSDTGLTQTVSGSLDASDEVKLSFSFGSDGPEVKVEEEQDLNTVINGFDLGTYKATVETISEDDAKDVSEALDILNDSVDKVAPYISSYDKGDITKDELKSKLKEVRNDNKKAQKEKIFNNKFEAGWKVTGTVSIKMEAVVAASVKWFKLKSYSVDLKSEITPEVKVEGKLSDDITLGKFQIPVGTTGASVGVAVVAHFELNGSVTIKAVLTDEYKIEYKDKKNTKVHDSSVSSSAEYEVSAEFAAGLNVSFCLLSFNIIDAEVTAAIKAKVEGSLTEAIDLEEINEDGEEAIILKFGYTLEGKASILAPIVKLKVGTGKSLVGKCGLSYEYEFISEEKIEKDNGKTFLYKSTPFPKTAQTWYLLKVTIPLDDEDETTTEETEEETTESETIEVGTLVLSDFTVIVDTGKSYKISLSALPAGYTEADLVWSVDDTSIATVSGGTVTGKSQGQTVVTVKTGDGKYSGQCAVLVN